MDDIGGVCNFGYQRIKNNSYKQKKKRIFSLKNRTLTRKNYEKNKEKCVFMFAVQYL